jgi:DNA-binding MarR family transcriptional regulator
MMVEDVVRTLGFLTLGSRFKRIGERLQADTQRIMDEMGVPLQASQYPFLAAIDRLGPLTIGELADAVGITQPGATRALAQLVDSGVLDARQAPEDQRRKVVKLTKKGRRLVETAKREVWPRVEEAVRDLCGGLSGPLLDQLGAIEDGLAAAPLRRRVRQAGRESR